MMDPSCARVGLAVASALCVAVMSGAVLAQQEKPADEPVWAIGRPKTDAALKMAPVAAFPVPTPAEKLPKLKAPLGFKVEVWRSGILDARALRRGDKGTMFVSTLFVANKVYAVTDKGGKRETKTIVDKLEMATGIEFHKGALYVATPKQITRYDNIEANLDKPPEPKLVTDKLPGDAHHGWKYIRIGPDGKLYVPVGAPCNICEVGDKHAVIMRMNLDGSGIETVAKGVRNSVGFDFHPKTGELWFTDNQRDWLSEDMPSDELNRVAAPGKDHFGYPFCHAGQLTDPQYGWGRSCNEFVKPAALLGPHMAPLGMSFYRGKMFPQKYQNAIFIARHGPWNRTKKDADVAVAYLDPTGKRVTSVEPFLTGFVENNAYIGRPVDILFLPDGSMLVSDDHAGAIYRVSYGR